MMGKQGNGQYLVERILRMLYPPQEEGRTEEWEREMSDAFVLFMDEMPGGFLIYRADQSEEIIYANRGLLRIFQCDTMEEFRAHTGNSFRGLVHPDDLEAVEASIGKQIAASQYDLDYVEYRIRRRDGEIRWIEDYGHFVHTGAAGDIFYVFLGDATEKRNRLASEKLEREETFRQVIEEDQALLAEALAKANSAIASRNAFLSNMSHDMRTPLNAIFGFTSLAKMYLHDPAEVADYLDRVEEASRQLLDMIEKVLQISEQSGKSGMEETEFDLRDEVKRVCDFLQPQAQEKDIDFTVDCSGLRHRTVCANQEKVRQLMLYLVNNAVTYTNSGGRVSVTVAEAEELPNSYAVYRFVVKDTGIGISPEFLEQIFEPFSREKNSTLSGVHGIGLGLTIAKNIVDMMNGTLDVQSEVGKGSTFTATLAVRVLPEPGTGQHAAAMGKASQRILLVEDNEINREIETELLERLGFVIDPAENGKVAMDKIEKAAPGIYDLVLLDLQMPVMDGWQTAAAIRALPDPAVARIPIIALSANMPERDQQRSKECGIDAHLLKPMDLALLLNTIEQLTGKKHPS